MKYLLSVLFGLLLIPLTFADRYVPDENHTPPNAVLEQQEHAEDIQRQEEAMEEGKTLKGQEPQEKKKEEKIKAKPPYRS